MFPFSVATDKPLQSEYRLVTLIASSSNRSRAMRGNPAQLKPVFQYLPVPELKREEFASFLQLLCTYWNVQVVEPASQVYDLLYSKSNVYMQEVNELLQFAVQNLNMNKIDNMQNLLQALNKHREPIYEQQLQDYLMHLSSSEKTMLYNDMFEFLYQAASRAEADVPSTRLRALFTDSDLGIDMGDDACYVRNEAAKRVLFKEMVQHLENIKLDDGSLRRKDLQRLFILPDDKKRAAMEKKQQKEGLIREIVRRFISSTTEASKCRVVQEKDLDTLKIKLYNLDYASSSTIQIVHDTCQVMEVAANDMAQVLAMIDMNKTNATQMVLVKSGDLQKHVDMVVAVPTSGKLYGIKIISIPLFGNISATLPDAIPSNMEFLFVSLQQSHLGLNGKTVSITNPNSTTKVWVTFLEDLFVHDLHTIRRFFRKLKKTQQELVEMQKRDEDEYTFKENEDIESVLSKIGPTKANREALKYSIASSD